MVGFLNSVFGRLDALKDLPPLFFRLILAFGFLTPAWSKLTGFGNIVSWFESMGFFMPLVSAALATAAEAAGVVLLTLGLATRFISLPLMFVMAVAMFTVHWPNGFACGNNGYEINVYYFLMLFSLFVTGAGKYSLDKRLGIK
jgi:putative oxidoreductase